MHKQRQQIRFLQIRKRKTVLQLVPARHGEDQFVQTLLHYDPHKRTWVQCRNDSCCKHYGRPHVRVFTNIREPKGTVVYTVSCGRSLGSILMAHCLLPHDLIVSRIGNGIGTSYIVDTTNTNSEIPQDLIDRQPHLYLDLPYFKDDMFQRASEIIEMELDEYDGNDDRDTGT